MSLLFIILLLVLFVYLSRKLANDTSSTSRISEISGNQQWVDYLAKHYLHAKKNSEKTLLLSILKDLYEQGMPLPNDVAVQRKIFGSEDVKQVHATVSVPELLRQSSQLSTPEADLLSDSNNVAASLSPRDSLPANQRVAEIDEVLTEGWNNSETAKSLGNTELLLYFGAFLAVAAAGLFVGFAGASGPLRAVTVLAVCLLFYAVGIWLFKSKPKLKLAGLTFVGIGIMLAPIVGVAAYAYVFKDHGALMWLSTSLLCIILYAYALFTVRSTLLEYVFLGSFISLFLSGVSVLDGPAYMYGWMLAIAGLMLRLVILWQGKNGYLISSSESTAQLLIPSSIMVSVFLSPEYGVWQFAVSSLLGSIFYIIQAFDNEGEARDNTFSFAHILLVAGIAGLAYDFRENLLHVAWTLLFVSGLQTVVIAMMRDTFFARNIAAVSLFSSVTAVLFGLESPWFVMLSLLVLCLSAAIIWLHHNRLDVYYIFVGATYAIPIAYALMVWETAFRFSQAESTTLLFGSMTVVNLIVLLLLRESRYNSQEQNLALHSSVGIGILLTLFGGFFSGQVWVSVLAVIATILTYFLYRLEAEDFGWLKISAVIPAAPLLVTSQTPGLFLAVLLLGLGWHIFVALQYRSEISRWMGTLTWLLLPFAGKLFFPEIDDATWYTYTLMLATFGLLIARSIALKRLGNLHLTLVEIENKLKTDSWSYVYGYGISSLFVAISAMNSAKYMPILAAVFLTVVTVLVGMRIERRPEVLAFIPVFMQYGLWATHRTGDDFVLYIALSSILSVGSYVILSGLRDQVGKNAAQVLAVATMFIGPLIGLNGLGGWASPFALMIAGAFSMHMVWNHRQAEKEMAGAIILLGVLWALIHYGVTDYIVLSHVIAGFFVVYAIWRKTILDHITAQTYVFAALLTATIPLIFRALYDDTDGFYGLFLLFEQISFITIGYLIRNSLVTKWGIYLGLATVLYQLRDLGWLMLTVLALFIIGMAMYRLQKGEHPGGNMKN